MVKFLYNGYIVFYHEVFMSKLAFLLPFFLCPSLFTSASFANDSKCLTQQLKKAPDNITVAELKARCQQNADFKNLGAVSKRILSEIQTEKDPYVLTPHLMNYILPITYNDNINIEPYKEFGIDAGDLKHTEAKFQLSIKVPLIQNNWFIKYDAIYFGVTIKSFWQLYAKNVSAPFRETNYKPEIFYIAPLPLHPFGGNAGFALGLEHESNGQSGALSRSWNRVYAAFLYEKGNFAFAFKPWVRVKEERKKTPTAARGDDNPDIQDYLGHFQVTGAYAWENIQANFSARQNFKTNKGSLELGFTFPLSGRLRGYVQYFNGYGESLIDYNYRQQRFGIGIALTDFL
jgi:phospholipase A1